MKYEVTQQGAAGPNGPLKVGDVVELNGKVPGYLVNKCRRIEVASPNRSHGQSKRPKKQGE